MKLKNTEKEYGLIALTLHWLVAVTVVGLFALGYWMVDLTYYDDMYRTAPFIHKSVGVLLFGAMLFRLGWRLYSAPPKEEETIKEYEKKAAHIVHGVLYILIFLILVSGYLISTADGRAINVFGIFSVPATITNITNQEHYAGIFHWYAALTLMAFVGLHVLGALKHHFVDKDHTLKKILGIKRKD